jgi:hypothetical protein
MKSPLLLFDRPGRAAVALVGVVAAVSASTAVALITGIATAMPAAAEAGRCTENVDVRALPDATSHVVALCEEGTQVQVGGESRNGFLQLTDIGGWAPQEHVSVDGRDPAPAGRAGTSEGEDNGRPDDSGAADDVADDY